MTRTNFTGVPAVLLLLFVVAVATVTAAETPSYMRKLWEDLTARKKLFEETPEEEIKYWFEYAGPLQVSYCVLYY